MTISTNYSGNTFSLPNGGLAHVGQGSATASNGATASTDALRFSTALPNGAYVGVMGNAGTFDLPNGTSGSYEGVTWGNGPNYGREASWDVALPSGATATMQITFRNNPELGGYEMNRDATLTYPDGTSVSASVSYENGVLSVDTGGSADAV